MKLSQKEISQSLKNVQEKFPKGIVRGAAISESDRLRLLRSGWLVPVFKGWYALRTPDADPGDVTFWGIHYWDFVSAYLDFRFKDEYSLSAEHSLDLHTGNLMIPGQLIVIAQRGGTTILKLPNGNSILIYQDKKNLPAERERNDETNLWVMTLEESLTRVSPKYFRSNFKNAEIALRMSDPGQLALQLLEDKNYSPTLAGRLMGAMEHLGLDQFKKDFENILQSNGYQNFNEENPFDQPPLLALSERVKSPHVARMKTLWMQMRQGVIKHFPKTRRKPFKTGYVKEFEKLKEYDTYHSLSIEGYQVTRELIQMVESGEWTEETGESHENLKNALAAKGYAEAFDEVTKSILRIEQGENPGTVIKEDHGVWYRALFGASARAGIMKSHDLAGYRRSPVYIRDSRHVPPAKAHVIDLMEALFELLEQEDNPGVRAILGHFFFVFIHPYPDGNGRMGRFLLNTCLIAGGYPWTTIRVESRNQYMTSIEKAVVEEDIVDFCNVIASELEAAKK